MMTMKQFEKFLDVHGADATRWPEHGEAQAFLQESPQAREVLHRAAALDNALDRFEAPAMPKNLAVKAAVIPAAKAKRPVLERFWLPVAGTAFAALTGLMILTQPTPVQPDTTAFLAQIQQIASQTDEDVREADDLMALLAQSAAPPQDENLPAGDDAVDQSVWDYFMGSSG